MTATGVVLDVSALIIYARNDLQALPVDELLRVLREDTGGTVVIPSLSHADALLVLDGDKEATDRLWSLSDAFGVVPPSPDVQVVVDLIVSESEVSAGMAHAMVLAAQRDWHLATYAAGTLERVGFDPRLVLDLNQIFHD
ncbi:hypothetical protein ACWKSP_22395 [Micromonosporaceae bacterium Da 78-11]